MSNAPFLLLAVHCINEYSITQKIRIRKNADFFIQAAGLAYHRRAKRGAYHQGRVAPLYLINPFGLDFPAA